MSGPAPGDDGAFGVGQPGIARNQDENADGQMAEQARDAPIRVSREVVAIDFKIR